MQANDEREQAAYLRARQARNGGVIWGLMGLFIGAATVARWWSGRTSTPTTRHALRG